MWAKHRVSSHQPSLALVTRQGEKCDKMSILPSAKRKKKTCDALWPMIMCLWLGPVSRPELVASAGHCRHLILTGADSGQSLASPGVWPALTNQRPGLQQPGQSEARTRCPCRHLMSDVWPLDAGPHVTLNILPGWRVTQDTGPLSLTALSLDKYLALDQNILQKPKKDWFYS